MCQLNHNIRRRGGARISRPQNDTPTVKFIFPKKNSHDIKENFVLVGGRLLWIRHCKTSFGRPRDEIFPDGNSFQ